MGCNCCKAMSHDACLYKMVMLEWISLYCNINIFVQGIKMNFKWAFILVYNNVVVVMGKTMQSIDYGIKQVSVQWWS